MEDIFLRSSSSSSSDDESGPVIIAPPLEDVIPLDDNVIEMLMMEDSLIRGQSNNNFNSSHGCIRRRNRRRMTPVGASIIDVAAMDRAAEENAAAAAVAADVAAAAATINIAATADTAATVNDADHSDMASANSELEKVRTLKGMFNFANNLTAGSSIEQEAKSTSFTEESKKYLSNVFSTMTVNVHEEMNNSINILFDNKKQVDEHEFAFDVIAEYVYDLDYANDFEKLGGFHIFLPCIRSEHPSVRIKICELISSLVQQNPYCQEKFMENPKYLNALMSMVENDPNDDVRIRALSAISCLVRDNISGFWKFIEVGGKDLIINSLKTPIDKLKIKAIFMIYSTCTLGNDVAEMYVDIGVVEIICSIIMGMEKNVEPFHHDLILSALNGLIRLSPVRVKEICSSLEDLKQALASLKDSYSTDESKYQDENDQVLWLMETLTL
ncbi:hsp70-binding protein 1-like [Melanaphis sacchari]|uniref:Hsp70-binding protein 1 n=1 Tax=Melanaphis sacchari TaxID=742174 RepID=A0A2H8TCM1_9HEMI|nr:hsp70-binding protein 1-like [Melanaphis sacchari]